MSKGKNRRLLEEVREGRRLKHDSPPTERACWAGSDAGSGSEEVRIRPQSPLRGVIEDDLELLGGDGLDGEPLAFAQEQHLLQSGKGAEFGKGNRAGKLGLELDVHHEPARVVGGAFGIEVLAVRIPTGVIGVGFPHHGDGADDGGVEVAVVEKRPVPQLHLVAHQVAGLIVAHSVPALGLARCVFEVLQREIVGFGFQQPVLHASSSGSTSRPMRKGSMRIGRDVLPDEDA